MITDHNVMDHSSLESESRKRLSAMIENLRAVEEPKKAKIRLKFKDLECDKKDELHDRLKQTFPAKRSSIYSITASSGVDLIDTRKLLEAAKADKLDARAYSRVNALSDSRCLYVGSSKSLPSRLLQHLGYGARTTYSLQLSHWAREISGAFTIEALIYESIDQTTLCQLEDQLAIDQTPLFGRRGSV